MITSLTNFKQRIAFQNEEAIRINARRLEHLASLDLPIKGGQTLLEVGAGIGMLSSYFTDRGLLCHLTDGRPENVRVLEKKYPEHPCYQLDLNEPLKRDHLQFSVVFCYGTLYHLEDPWGSIDRLSQLTKGILLLETCVTPDLQGSPFFVQEPKNKVNQSVSGFACRPNRKAVWNALNRHFEYVYTPVTQPCHPEFPIDWSLKVYPTPLTRAVFVCSRYELNSDMLVTIFPMKHVATH
jgi:2-polyprenyl-3-methyl-5-hydroxy-6-metoxy-1,4-benzoquinol methylase